MKLSEGKTYSVTAKAGIFNRIYKGTEWCEFDNEPLVILVDPGTGNEKAFAFSRIEKFEEVAEATESLKVVSPEVMPTIAVKKITKNQVILEDGTIEEYKSFLRTHQNLSAYEGFAILRDGKVAKFKDGSFEIYAQKKAATRIAELLKTK